MSLSFTSNVGSKDVGFPHPLILSYPILSFISSPFYSHAHTSHGSLPSYASLRSSSNFIDLPLPPEKKIQ